MGGESGKEGKNSQYTHFLLENVKEWANSEGMGGDGWRILTRNFKKQEKERVKLINVAQDRAKWQAVVTR
jgi:hypothetical protein